FARQQVGRDHAIGERQADNRDAQVRPNTPAYQRVTEWIHPGAADHSHIVDARLQRVAPAHLQYLAITVNAVVVIIICRPVIGGLPLIAAGPGSRVPGSPVIWIAL